MLLGILLVNSSFAQSEQKKNLPAVRTTLTPKIDGKIDEPIWDKAGIASNFVQMKPNPGKVEAEKNKTLVKLLYDDEAIYVAARMYDHPDSIVKELMSRDKIGNADYLGIVFDTFNDGINGYGFFVTAAGVQFDAKYSNSGNEDPQWNAVWESAVVRDEQGWVAEMKIPYSALRFSPDKIQDWGLNMVRMRTKFNEQYFWNPVDPKVNGFINQSGILSGFEDIKAPIRLSFMPYVSALASHYPHNITGLKNTTTSLNGGMDVKYGINNSFTLDLTLIPDFGQVQSDNIILNLTPFEVRYDERRQFFTEGTELFNKGDLFYSRRIGNSPSYYHSIQSQLNPGETIVSTPIESKLINATKISGRTTKGLGIGFFNAITDKMFATVVDQNGAERSIENQPLTNYNILVLDQTLKNASSVSFVNTNVIRQGTAYDANVSAFLFDLRNKSQRYGLRGDVKASYIRNPLEENSNGYSYSLSFRKLSGNFTWSYTQSLADQKFDPSDMGFYTNNNFFDHDVRLSYNIYEPGKWYNSMESYLFANYSRKFRTGAYQEFGFYAGHKITLKNFWTVDLDLDYNAAGNDFYESRGLGVFRTSPSKAIIAYVHPNRALNYYIGGSARFTSQKMMDGNGYNVNVYQNLRVSDKFSLNLESVVNPSYNYVNYLTSNAGRAVFSRYNRNTVENSVGVKFTFNEKMGLDTRIRHYWSDRRNKEFYYLNVDGGLDPYNNSPIQNADQTFNIFNVDLVYTWVFAPGSELNVTYKNAAQSSQQFHRKRYFNNFDHILNAPQVNSLSIKVLYFIDYLDLKKKK